MVWVGYYYQLWALVTWLLVSTTNAIVTFIKRFSFQNLNIIVTSTVLFFILTERVKIWVPVGTYENKFVCGL